MWKNIKYQQSKHKIENTQAKTNLTFIKSNLAKSQEKEPQKEFKYGLSHVINNIKERTQLYQFSGHHENSVDKNIVQQKAHGKQFESKRKATANEVSVKQVMRNLKITNEMMKNTIDQLNEIIKQLIKLWDKTLKQIQDKSMELLIANKMFTIKSPVFQLQKIRQTTDDIKSFSNQIDNNQERVNQTGLIKKPFEEFKTLHKNNKVMSHAQLKKLNNCHSHANFEKYSQINPQKPLYSETSENCSDYNSLQQDNRNNQFIKKQKFNRELNAFRGKLRELRQLMDQQ